MNSGNITKIKSTKASITLTRDDNADGIEVDQKKKSKWVDVTKSKSKIVKKTWSKNSAGSSSYRARTYFKDRNGKTIGYKTMTQSINGGVAKTKTYTLDKSVKEKDLYRVEYSVKYYQRH